MSESISVTERQAFRSFWDDGLLDVMVGLVVLIVGLSWWQDLVAIGAAFPAVCISLWYPLRKRLIEPRMGYVEFRGDRELEVRGVRFGLSSLFAGMMLLGAVIFLFWKREAISQPVEWAAGLPLVLIGIPVIFVALFTNCRRFAVYALAVFLAGAEVVAQGQEPHVGMIGSGILITGAGLVILARFLTRHPAQPPEPS